MTTDWVYLGLTFNFYFIRSLVLGLFVFIIMNAARGIAEELD